VFFERCELRLKKQLRTVLPFVAVQHVVVISFQLFRTTDWCHLDFGFLTFKGGTDRFVSIHW